MADILAEDGTLTADDATRYRIAASDWAFSYEDVGDLSVLIAQL